MVRALSGGSYTGGYSGIPPGPVLLLLWEGGRLEASDFEESGLGRMSSEPTARSSRTSIGAIP